MNRNCQSCTTDRSGKYRLTFSSDTGWIATRPYTVFKGLLPSAQDDLQKWVTPWLPSILITQDTPARPLFCGFWVQRYTQNYSVCDSKPNQKGRRGISVKMLEYFHVKRQPSTRTFLSRSHMTWTVNIVFLSQTRSPTKSASRADKGRFICLPCSLKGPTHLEYSSNSSLLFLKNRSLHSLGQSKPQIFFGTLSELWEKQDAWTEMYENFL